MTASLTITPSAAAQINKIRTQKGNPNLMFRIMVMGGGCSGFKYHFDFDAVKNDWDLTFVQNGATVIVDDMSVQFVRDAELDFEKDLSGARFVVNNPNAASGCGCGSSFAVKID